MIGLENGSWVYENICKAVIKYCDFGLRETEKYYRMAKIAAYKPTHKEVSFELPDEKGLKFSICIFVPIIIGLQMSDIEKYNDFVNGKNSAPLIDILGDNDIAIGYLSSLLDDLETYNLTDNNQMKKVKLSDKLNLVYDVVFGESNNNEMKSTDIGQYEFSHQMKRTILNVVNMQSDYTSYE